MTLPKRMNFQKSSKGRGGGGIFNPKNHIARNMDMSPVREVGQGAPAGAFPFGQRKSQVLPFTGGIVAPEKILFRHGRLYLPYIIHIHCPGLVYDFRG